MKKNLRLLCLGLAAATFTCGFAQENMTSSLKNADMELGLKSWAFDGVDVMGKNTKNVASQIGFHGMNKGVQEQWHANPENPLGDNYVMQRVKKLPAGTYVFGAYVGASKQTKTITESNRDSICGVSLFANNDSVAVRTANPDLAYKYKWAHSSKFNVATTLSDEGTLLVGLNVKNTIANYVVWDNATLYYFGDMSKEAALDAMAQIDMNNAIAIADTLVDEEKGIVMHVDTLKNLKDAIKIAKAAKTTNATLWNDLEELFYNMGLARRSATDYANLGNHIKSALYIKDSCTWSKDGMDLYYGDFESALEMAQEAYEEAESDRAEITELRNELTRQIGWMRVDSFYTARQALNAFITSAPFTDKAGEYTTAQKEQLQAYDKMLGDTLRAIEGQPDDEARPQDLYPFIPEIYAAIEEVKNNPFDGIVVWSQTLPRSTEALKGYKPLAGTAVVDDVFEYTSPLLEFDGPAEAIRLTVTTSASDAVFFTLSALEFYDKDNNRIALDASSLSSNADHNSLPGNGKDGDGLPALVDDNAGTYFHSDWGNKVSEPHYLQVLLPNGGYDALYFKMIARGASHVHQFPGEIIVTTPEVNHTLNELVVQLNEAKALEAYVGTDPGFYTGVENPELFAEVAAAIVEAEALIANEGASTAMNASKERLRQAIYDYKTLDAEKYYSRPEAGKVYRIVSGFPGFFDKQNVEKALTVHVDSMKTLWWQNVCADSVQQEFMFEPLLDEDGEPFVEQVPEGKNEDGSDIMVPYYCYKLKNVKYDLYVDSAFVGDPRTLKLVEEALDTVKLKWLGRGQWNIIVRGNVLHCGDHNSGNPGTTTGAYGGIWGIGSRIVPYGGGLDGASAWFIREMPTMPYTVEEVSEGDFRSNCIHFDATDSLTLTADKDCAFENLVLYDLYGGVISAEVKVEGAVATISTKSPIAACAFAFNNAEGVSSVTLDIVPLEIVVEEEDVMAALEAKYETTLAVAPEKGTNVGQYDDITEYAAAIEAAEAMIENGAEDAELKAMIAQLDSAVAHLKNPHMPEAGKYYFIVSGLSAFEEKLSYNMALYPKNAELCWAQENELDSARCWQFEPATVEDLKSVGAPDTTVTAFYIKNLGSGEYFGHIAKDAFKTNDKVPMAYDKRSAMPYKVTKLPAGTAIAFDDAVYGQRIHGLGHGGGSGKSGNITYWNSGVETASAWRIVETENDFILFSNLDFTEIEPEAPVVKGVYDLFGRRLVAPTTPGIYIIDGKKRVIK